MPATNKIQDLFNVEGLVVVITGGGILLLEALANSQVRVARR